MERLLAQYPTNQYDGYAGELVVSIKVESNGVVPNTGGCGCHRPEKSKKTEKPNEGVGSSLG